MTDGYQLLAKEIQHVVDSPYPTQLKRLRDIATDHCTPADITRWTLAKPCHIDRLTACILHSLRQWPYTLELVTRLCSSIKIRDSLLRAEPSLLHDIVVQACKSEDVQSGCHAAAVAMLSHSLPENVSMPAEAQNIFVQLFQHAARDPKVVTIRPIYHMLKGTGVLLLGVLSSKTLLRLEEQLFVILRSIKGDNQSLSLYCLAIMKTMTGALDDIMAFSTSSYDTQELLLSMPVTPSHWNPSAMRQFFSESKAQKTLQLIVLRVMWACTTSTSDPLEDRMESLELAHEVLVAVPARLREEWRKSNVMVVRKLEEKVLSDQLDSQLRAQGLFFVARLTESGMTPVAVIDRLRCLFAGPSQPSSGASNASVLDVDFLAAKGVLDQKTTTVLLQNVVDYLISSDLESTGENTEFLARILERLSSTLASEERVVEGTVLALDVLSCGDKLASLLKLAKRSTMAPQIGDRTAACDQAFINGRNYLIHQLANVYLKASLRSTQSTYAPSTQTTSLLLELHASSAQHTVHCAHMFGATSGPARSLLLGEHPSVLEPISKDWRNAVGSYVHGHAQDEQHALLRVFTEACSDLESRCESVEKPLREEKERTAALQERYDELEQAYARLETMGIDRDVHLSALEAERDHVIEEKEALEVEVQKIGERFSSVQGGLESALEQARLREKDLCHKLETLELGHATALAKKEEDLEELQEECEKLAQDFESKIRQLDNIHHQHQQTRTQLESAREDIDRLKTTLNQSNATNQERETEHRGTLQTLEHLRNKLGETRSFLDIERQARHSDQESAAQQQDAELAAATSRHEHAVLALSNEHKTALEGAESQLNLLQDELSRAQERHTSELELRSSQLKERQKMVDRLTRKCTEKDVQIAEANAMRANMMAFLGGNNTAMAQSRPSRSSATIHRDTQAAKPVLQDQENPSPPTPFSGDDSSQAHGPKEHETATAAAPVATASFASSVSTASQNGPTPKRARPRKAFKVPSPVANKRTSPVGPRETRASRGSMGGGGSLMGFGTIKRQPLAAASTNKSPGKRETFKTPSKAVARVDWDDGDTFDDVSELFAGTPGG